MYTANDFSLQQVVLLNYMIKRMLVLWYDEFVFVCRLLDNCTR